MKINADIIFLKKAMIYTFYGTSNNSLYTLQFNLVDHIVEDLKRFGTRTVLDASSVDQYNIHVNRSSREASKLQSSIMDEIVRIISSNPTTLLHNANVKLSLSNKEEIIIQKKGVTEKVVHIFLDGIHVKIIGIAPGFFNLFFLSS